LGDVTSPTVGRGFGGPEFALTAPIGLLLAAARHLTAIRPAPSMERVNVAAFTLAGLLLATASSAAPTQPLHDTLKRPLTGERYETLRALTHYLDQTAMGVLEDAISEVRHGNPGDPQEARFVYSIRSFARSAGRFSRRVDDYPANPFEVPPQVAALTDAALEISDRLRAAHALEGTKEEWAGVNDVLHRMSELMEGRQVEVPAPYVVPALSGDRLAEFRQLAHDLELSTTRTQETAKREARKYPRGEQFLGELGYFASQSRDLHRRAESGPVSPQLLGAMVAHLLEEARLADRRMRDAHTLLEVWDDSGRSITMLHKMASLVQA